MSWSILQGTENKFKIHESTIPSLMPIFCDRTNTQKTCLRMHGHHSQNQNQDQPRKKVPYFTLRNKDILIEKKGIGPLRREI